MSIKVKFSTGPAEANQLNTLDVGLVSEDTAVTSTTKVVFLENGEPLVVGENVPADSYIKAGDEVMLTYRLEAGYVEGELVDGWVMERANDAYARELFTLTGDTANTYIQANENFYSVKEVSAHGTGGTQSSIQSVVDNLETDSQYDALSARQGMLLNNALTGKQDTLIFTGETAHLKTINGQSLQGPGNIQIQAGEGTGGTSYYEGTGITINTANTISISNPTWQLIDNKYDKTGGTVSGSVIALEEVSAYGTGGTQSSIQSVIDNLSSSSQTDALSANQGRILNTTKQDTLISGVNIKTINNQSILGEGNINIQGGGGTGGTSYNAGTGITISSDTISISDSTWGIINNKYDKTGGTVYGSVFAEQEVSSYGTGGTQSQVQSVINNLDGSVSVYDALSAIQGKVLDDKISDKQDTLVSGVNIKTINGSAITGSGNLYIPTGEGGGTTYNAGTGITITSDTISISDATWALIDDKYDKTGGTVSGSVIALEEVSSYGAGGTQSSIQTVENTLDSTSTTNALSANQGRVLNNKFSTKQDTLVSGVNIKTINGSAITGSGNLFIPTGGGGGGSDYYAGANIAIDNYVISVTGITGSSLPSLTAGTAINATKLDNHPSDYFVNTATTQTISGVKTFNENIIGMKDISAYGSGGTQSSIQSVINNLTSTGATATTNALSAYQGKVLNDKITGLTASKQDTLISGTNIKTINNQSILGSGNITIEGGGGDTAVYATYLGNSSSNYSKSTLDTALAGKLGTGATAADSSKLGGVAASSYAQTNGTYNNMTVGRATTWDGYKLAIVSSIPSSPRTDTIYFGY